jgi:hypothetical protein
VAHIYETTRASRGSTFAPPIAHGELNTSNGEESPGLTPDGLDIYYTAAQAGSTTLFDVYAAHRTALDQPFGTPEVVPALSSVQDDRFVHISNDGRSAYVNYNASVTPGLSVATRSCREE